MENNLFDFKGKTALISGASRGIGESIAKAFAARGAHVILTGRKIEGLKQVEEQIKSDGGEAFSAACHIGHMSGIDELFKLARAKYDKLDILVNNGATNPFFGDILEADPGVWEKIVSVNLRGYFFMSQQAAKFMKEKGNGGAIVNVSSINGVSPAIWQSVYSITKAGVISMTKAFAKELALLNIRVNAILPGLTDTKFAAAVVQNKNILSAVLPMIPMHRVAQPDEMVGAALYLASDAASYTTGACLAVDGGMLA